MRSKKLEVMVKNPKDGIVDKTATAKKMPFGQNQPTVKYDAGFSSTE